MAQEDIREVIENASPGLSLLFIIGTAGVIPSVVISAVLRKLVEELRKYAATKGQDMKVWDATEQMIFDKMDSAVITMPKDTVLQKGGQA